MATLPETTVTVTLDDMSVDLVCFEHAMLALGDRRAAGRLLWAYVAATLEANPGLAGLGDMLPIGTVIRLPRHEAQPSRAPTKRLWDK